MTQKIYIGPSLTRGRLNMYTIYIDGLPKHLNAEMEKCPEIKKLFVKVTGFSEKVKERDKKGTPLHKYYEKVKEALKNGL